MIYKLPKNRYMIEEDFRQLHESCEKLLKNSKKIKTLKIMLDTDIWVEYTKGKNGIENKSSQ